jgi:glycosyltransferase involved in cell wall biosynthesis
MKSVLIVSFFYPPQGIGLARVTRFVRYLPDFGYQPIVLTTDRYGGLPTDATERVHRAGDVVDRLFRPLRRHRTQGIPPEMQYRVATLPNESLLARLRDRVMIPDTKIGWLPGATRLGRALIERYRPALVFSTSPPETSHLIAQRLHTASGLPWVMDLRDGWLFEPPNAAVRRPRARRWLESRLENRAVCMAQAIVTATAPLADDLAARYPAARLSTITNGYDPAEFSGLSRRRIPDGTFLLVYTGALGASREGTSADAFFAGLAAMRARRPSVPMRVRVVGNIRESEKVAAQAAGVGDAVEFLPPVSPLEAHQHQLDADALLLITAPGQRSLASLKLFDYIGAGVPILALAQDNAAADIVQHYRLGVTAPPDAPAAIAAALDDLVRRWQAIEATPGGAVRPPESTAAQRHFDCRNLTEQLASIFDQVTPA